MSIISILMGIFRQKPTDKEVETTAKSGTELEYPPTFDIPYIGEVKLQEYEWYQSVPIRVPGFKDKMSFILDGYAFDEEPEEWHEAIDNFLNHGKSALDSAEDYLFDYYTDICNAYGNEYNSGPNISSAKEVWNHISMSLNEAHVTRRHHGNQNIYISLECGCSWEEEHGLQIVFQKGKNVTKIGPYDGHVTNSDAFGRSDLENVVYHKI